MAKVLGQLALIAFGAGAALAQSSPSFQIDSQTLNAGGHPAGGIALSSASFRISLDAIGDAATALDQSSVSFSGDGGFPASSPPPGEVAPSCNATTPQSCVRFTSKTVLAWPAEPSIGTYGLYRAAISTLSALGFGSCSQSGLASETAVEPDVPTAGAGFFYLVTARNRFGEEGTKGFRSQGIERGNPAPCP